MSNPTVPPSSAFRFLNIKKKFPKTFRSNATDGPKLISTNETKLITTTDSIVYSELTPDVG
jgi:hypothetical protein